MESEVTKDDKDIGSALHEALAERIGRERFELWFGNSTRIEIHAQRLTIGVPNQFLLDWIRSNFRRQIDAACKDLFGKPLTIRFHVDPSLAANEDGVSPAENESTDSPTAAQDRGDSDPVASVTPLAETPSTETPPTETPPAETILAQTIPPTHKAIARKARSPRKTTRRRPPGLNAFVEGDGNDLALTMAKTVVQQPGQYSPLMIHGPTSVGKTHLLQGILQSARKANRTVAAVYLSAEQFTTLFLEALRGGGLPSFRRKYRGVQLLIVDDLQFLCGKRATQIELLHTIDTMLRDGRQLVFSADRPPNELADLGPEMITRLQGGMVCKIELPDYLTRLGILGQMAGRLDADVPSDVQEYVASHLTGHARELSGALCRLHATSVALGRPISLDLARESLAEMIRDSGPTIRLADIEKAVCDVFDLEAKVLRSDRKAKRVSHPRMLAMWLARKHTRAALSEIGQFFGHRAHSTVISAQRRVEQWMADGQSLILAESTCDVDKAIRRVERELRAG